MKTFAQFIKETYHMQEKLDATVYGQVRYGAPPSKPKSDKQISNMVSKGIDDYKSGKPVQPPGKSTAKKRKFSFSGYANLSYEKKSGGGKTPPPTKVRPDKTTDPKTPKNTKSPKTTTKLGGTKTVKTVKTVKAVKGGGGRPNKSSGNDVRPIKTSTPPPSTSSSSTNVLTKGSNTSSSSSTNVLTKGSNTSSSPSTSVLQKTTTKPSTPVRPMRRV